MLFNKVTTQYSENGISCFQGRSVFVAYPQGRNCDPKVFHICPLYDYAKIKTIKHRSQWL